MKLLTIFIVLLGFGPTILDYALSGSPNGTVLAPTKTYPTKTYDPFNALNAGKVVLEVPPTSVARPDHNNAGLSGSRISISTKLRVPYGTVTGFGHVFLKPDHRRPRNFWSNRQHWSRINSTFAIRRASVAFLLLGLLFTVGLDLLREQAPPRSSLQSEPVAVSAQLEPRGTVVCRAIGQPGQVSRQPSRPATWIRIYLAEGALSMQPGFTSSDSGELAQWPMLFHPYHRQDSAHLNTRVAIDGRLFNVLLHGIASYHPWALRVTIGFNIPWELLKELGQGDAAAVVPSPLPSSLPSPCSALRYEPPIAEAANPLLPSTPFGVSYPEAIHSFNRPLSTNQYISWLYLTRPSHPLPNRPVPVEQAVAVRDQLRPVLRNLATRAEPRHPPRPSANVQMESGEARLKEEEAGASFAEENQSEIQNTEESSLETLYGGTKPHRGGRRAARMKRQLAGEEGHSKSN